MPDRSSLSQLMRCHATGFPSGYSARTNSNEPLDQSPDDMPLQVSTNDQARFPALDYLVDVLSEVFFDDFPAIFMDLDPFDIFEFKVCERNKSHEDFPLKLVLQRLGDPTCSVKICNVAGTEVVDPNKLRIELNNEDVQTNVRAFLSGIFSEQ